MAQRHGWSEEPITGVAYTVLAGAMVAHARLEEQTDGLPGRMQRFDPKRTPRPD